MPGELERFFGDEGEAISALGSSISDVAIQADDKIVAVGGDLVRFDADGDLDTGFGGSDGSALTGPGSPSWSDLGFSAVAVQTDGKIVAAGEVVTPVDEFSGDSDFAVARFDADGSPDTSFGGDGLVITDFGSNDDRITSLVVQPDGELVVAGWTAVTETNEGENDWEDFTVANYNFALARYETDGTLDSDFSGDGKLTTDIPGSKIERAWALLQQPDGKLVAVGRGGVFEQGTFESHGGFSLARYNPDGTLDQDFGDGGLVALFDVNRMAFAAALQPDGKIVVGGSWGGDIFSLSRFDADGSLDLSFGEDGSVDHLLPAVGNSGPREGAIDDLAIQPDGRILAVGGANDQDENWSTDDFALARYNPNGALDMTFGGKGLEPPDGVAMTSVGDGGYGNVANAVALQSDGKIVVGGSTGETTNDFALARYEGGGPPLVERTLTVHVSGSGSVHSTPDGIDCSSTCSHSFFGGEAISLEATAGAGSFLLGWGWPSGAPGCTFAGESSTCELTLSEDAEVTAEFKANDKPQEPSPPGGKDSQPAGDGNQSGTPSTALTAPTPGKSAADKKSEKHTQDRKRALKRCMELEGKAKRRCVKRANKKGQKRGRKLRAAGSASDGLALLSAESPEKTCAGVGTALPKILDGGPWINHPGDRKTQNFAAEVDYQPLPSECASFRRIPMIKFEVQDPERHLRWIDAGGYQPPTKTRDVQDEELEALEREREEEGKSCWKPIPGGEENTCRIDIHIGNAGGVAEDFFSPPRRLHEPSYSRHDPRLYRCTPGKDATRVRALFQNTVKSSTGKVVARKISVVPVRVRSYPGKGPMPNAWRGAVRGPC